MDRQTQNMILVGYHHFNSKDKTQIYYVVQCLYSENDLTRGNRKGTMINIFVDDDIYKKILEMDIGTVLKVEIIPNLNSGKLSYKVVL